MEDAAECQGNASSMDDPDRARQYEKPNQTDQPNGCVFAIHNVCTGRFVEGFMVSGTGHDARFDPCCRHPVSKAKVQKQIDRDIETDHLKWIVDHVCFTPKGCTQVPVHGIASVVAALSGL